jgi:hypothetical protein
MKNNIVENGPERLAKGRYDRNIEATRAKYADELKTAHGLKRLWLNFLIEREARKPGPTENHPSPSSLWLS